jgi:hypothetical protein
MTAKMISRHHVDETRKDWNAIRLSLMRWCLKVKMLQNWEIFHRVLLQTGSKPIVEKSRKDDFWGAREVDFNTLKGVNALGRLLMELREKVHSPKPPTVVLPLRIPDFLLYGSPIRPVRKINHPLPKEQKESTQQQRKKQGEIPFERMKTTYVFGAGASLHVGYPLASKMSGDLLDFMLNYPIDRYRDSARFIIETFGQTLNIEDLITDLEARIEACRNKESHYERAMIGVWGNPLAHLSEMLREWFRVIHNNPAPLYAEFADRVLKAGDTVITFNYDDSLDRELKRVGKWDLSCGYGFQLGNSAASSDVLLLKLHGSMNWMLSVFGGITSGGPVFVSPRSTLGDRPVIHDADAKYLGYSDFSGNTYPGGAVSMKSLILPGRCKRFFVDTSFGREFERFWNDLWSQGATALTKTDRLVICGYSMPKVDERARDLLLKKTPKHSHVTIISGADGERIANDFRTDGLQNVEAFKGGYFQEWLQSLSTKATGA